MSQIPQADIYGLHKADALSREEFFSQKKLLQERGVAAHEMSYARLLKTCDLLMQELINAGILEPMTEEEIGTINPKQ